MPGRSAPASLVVAVTPGCPASVGPSVAARAVASVMDRAHPSLLVVGAAEPILKELRRAGLRVPSRRVTAAGAALARPAEPGVHVVDTGQGAAFPAGHPSDAGDRAAARALDLVVFAARDGQVDAVATGPVRKQVFDLVKGGPFPGHTEMFHRVLGTGPVPVMLFMAPGMRMALHTIHLPLAEVPRHVTRAALLDTLSVLHGGLLALGGRATRVDVLGLNPHAGEGGRLGREEIDAMVPALEDARRLGMDVLGPFPADGYMASWAALPAARRPGAVLAMFHDQGLVAFKLVERRRGFQVTLGLRVPRTACDHGTAHDLARAGGQADPRSMTAALRMALRLAGRNTGMPLR